jgi:HPt (histidine-containing phosphotransfer) domain-containing protein
LATAVSEGKMTAPAQGPRLDIDTGRLAEMLDLVGPASEERLLRSLIEDLETARSALLHAASRHDRVALRQQTHVLASLAATFGAPALNTAARELQASSRTTDLWRGEGATAGLDPGPVVRLTENMIAELTDRLAGLQP